jgi:hypothetical protein
MLVIDNILMFPIRGLLRVFREIQNAVDQEYESEGDAIRTELRELYMKLETNRITEKEFDEAEKMLLDRLDQIEARDAGADDEPDTDG